MRLRELAAIVAIALGVLVVVPLLLPLFQSEVRNPDVPLASRRPAQDRIKQAEPPAPTGDYGLTGRVVYESSLEPVATTVRLEPGGIAAATDKFGRFYMPRLQPGIEQTLVVTVPGFAILRHTFTPTSSYHDAGLLRLSNTYEVPMALGTAWARMDLGHPDAGRYVEPWSVAAQKLQPGAYALRPRQGSPVLVRVPDGLAPAAPEPASLVLRFELPDGTPESSRALLQHLQVDGTWSNHKQVYAKDGYVKVEGLAPGAWRVIWTRFHGEEVRQPPVWLREGETKELSAFTVARLGELTVNLTGCLPGDFRLLRERTSAGFRDAVCDHTDKRDLLSVRLRTGETTELWLGQTMLGSWLLGEEENREITMAVPALRKAAVRVMPLDQTQLRSLRVSGDHGHTEATVDPADPWLWHFQCRPGKVRVVGRADGGGGYEAGQDIPAVHPPHCFVLDSELTIPDHGPADVELVVPVYSMCVPVPRNVGSGYRSFTLSRIGSSGHSDGGGFWYLSERRGEIMARGLTPGRYEVRMSCGVLLGSFEIVDSDALKLQPGPLPPAAPVYPEIAKPAPRQWVSVQCLCDGQPVAAGLVQRATAVDAEGRRFVLARARQDVLAGQVQPPAGLYTLELESDWYELAALRQVSFPLEGKDLTLHLHPRFAPRSLEVANLDRPELLYGSLVEAVFADGTTRGLDRDSAPRLHNGRPVLDLPRVPVGTVGLKLWVAGHDAVEVALDAAGPAAADFNRKPAQNSASR